MKKMLLAVMLLGFGMMVGCGDEPKKTTTGDTSAKPSSTVSHSNTTATPAHDTK